MFYFIEEILEGKTKFHWEKVISDNMHQQLMEVKKTSLSFMTSYLVYLLAEKFPYKGLFCVKDLGTKQGQLKLYDCYPQLQYRNFEREYKRVNDAFIGHIIKLLGGDFERRVTHNKLVFMKGLGYLFIKFPKFTYIRLKGFSRRPYRLPHYPNDRIIMLEASWQVQTSHTLLSNKHRPAIPYPLTLRESLYSCLAT